MNQESQRQYDHYAAVRKRLMSPRAIPRKAEPVIVAIAHSSAAKPRAEPVARPPAPVKQRVIVRPWPKPLWLRKPAHFNQQVIDYLYWKLAEERGIDPTSPPRRSMLEIAADALKSFKGVSMEEIRGRRRTQPVVRARQFVMYSIYKEREDTSLPEIGRFFGGKDHTTVLHAVKKLEGVYGKITREQGWKR